MLTPDEKFNIIKQSLKDGFKGSVSSLIDSVEKEALNVDKVANTEAEQEKGLRGDTKGQTMAFTNSNEDFNTKGMKYPIDIEKKDEKGDIVRSYKNVPPGIENLPMGDKVGTVIESASEYQMGGEKTAEDPKSDPGLKAFIDNVASRMEELEKEFNAAGKTFDSPGRYLYQEGGAKQQSLVQPKYEIADALKELFASDIGMEEEEDTSNMQSLNNYDTYRSKQFQTGGQKQNVFGEMIDPIPTSGPTSITGLEGVSLGGIVKDHFEDNDYNAETMTKIMDYIGLHETNDDYAKIQESEKSDGTKYDGPGRGRYQFENNKSGGGMTAINRTMNFFEGDEDFEDNIAYANIRNAWRGELEGQESKKHIDFSTLPPEEQDFLFIFNYLNGKESATAELKSLLTQETEVTSDQIFDFWIKHHKVSTSLGREEELKRWNSRTSSMTNPEEEVEEEPVE
tara:strand:- start:773 stop:2131 length:1359 start_codon:yes stop_codon:yes gene_type:complete